MKSNSTVFLSAITAAALMIVSCGKSADKPVVKSPTDTSIHTSTPTKQIEPLATEQDDGSTKYRGRKFTIVVPADWKWQEQYEESELYMSGPPSESDDSFHRNVNVMVDDSLPPRTMLAAFYDSNVESAKKDYGMSVLKQGNESINGLEVMTATLSEKNAKGVSVIAKQYYLIKGSTGIIVTAHDLATEFEKHAPEFDSLMRTFQLN